MRGGQDGCSNDLVVVDPILGTVELLRTAEDASLSPSPTGLIATGAVPAD